MGKRDASKERTSADVAKIAAQVLNGRKFADAIAWLQKVADQETSTQEAREHANQLLGGYESMRRVAASALTQR